VRSAVTDAAGQGALVQKFVDQNFIGTQAIHGMARMLADVTAKLRIGRKHGQLLQSDVTLRPEGPAFGDTWGECCEYTSKFVYPSHPFFKMKAPRT